MGLETKESKEEHARPLDARDAERGFIKLAEAIVTGEDPIAALKGALGGGLMAIGLDALRHDLGHGSLGVLDEK